MLQEVLDVLGLLDGWVTGDQVAKFLENEGAQSIRVTSIEDEDGKTDFLTIHIKGTAGREENGNVPTLGIIGRLGGIGARPGRIGLVSDADGAIGAIATALKLIRIKNRGDVLKGDVIISTHICPNAPTIPHSPVDFMGSPVDMMTLNKYEVSSEMEAIIVIDGTKGNYVLNRRGIAITPTVKEGYILPISYPMLDLLSYTTGELPKVLPLSLYDITPYGNDLFHINSILQPSVVTDAAVVGLAITAETIIPGCATGANQEIDIRNAVAFCVEVAKKIEPSLSVFYNSDEFKKAQQIYGDLNHLRKGISDSCSK